jgi:dTDP-glucose 4,6-dehydratase
MAQMRLNEGRVVPVLSLGSEERAYHLYGEGKQTRSFCYCSDLIEEFTGL